MKVFGKPYSKQRNKVAYVPQRGSVDWDFPTDALDVVEMGLYGKLGWLHRPNSHTKEKARECLKKVSLEDYADRQIGQLSGGQQQRVAVARALAHKPTFVIADEPTANLDSKSTADLLNIMEELNQKEGTTFIFSTHDQRLVDRAKRVIVFEDGKVISDTSK